VNVAVAVAVAVGVEVGVGVKVAVGVPLGVAVGVAVGVGVGPVCAQYLPPLLKLGPRKLLYPPQIIISLPLQTAV
jgi:hypothetical protein